MSSYSGIPYGFYLDTSVGRCSIDSIRIKFSYKFSTYSWSKKCAVPAVDYISDLLDLYDIFAMYPTADVSWAYRDFFRIGSYCRTACISGVGWSCAVLVGRYCYDSSCKLVAPEAVFDFNPNVAFADFPDSLPLGPGFQAKTLISLCGFSPFFCCVGDFAGRVHLGSVTFFSCLPIGQSVRGMQAAPPPWPGDGPQAQRCRCVVGMAPPTVGSFL